MSSLPGSSLPPPSKRPAARLPTQAELDRQYLHTSFQPLVSALDQAIDDGDAARVKDELDAGPPPVPILKRL
ncbi:hypothetical protein Tdes44962_MAKER00260 [Teratosphaeria destructans]|uniref:Uncharacterized protein n=1 Tax=Teratosphaeria destructans TaxID=418781 RepID=A0A9W7SVM2_9PEZI|nr:hypothetical protein Tdes44962_MAKER00260 [Teratosphaeria destructans]